MVIKESFLQGSKGGLEKKFRLVWNWKYPVTSLLCGLVALTRIRCLSEKENESKTVTFSHQEEGMIEVAMVTLKEGEQLVFRPLFLAGMIYREGELPWIRSRWIFNQLHAWVTLQFRYFIVTGPVRLLFTAGRGIQEEKIEGTEESFRINRNLTIGFSPSLEYRSRRAETLMAYVLGKNPLFDDYFSKEGRLYNQQIAGLGEEGESEKIWSKILGGIGKVFGL